MNENSLIKQDSNNQNSNPNSMFIETFLMVNAKNLPTEKIPYLREKLYSLPETRVKSIQAFPFKDSTISLVLSLFLGPYGVDRFFLGEVGLGILKLVTLGGCGIWAIIDWFLIMNKTREYNFYNLMLFLG